MADKDFFLSTDDAQTLGDINYMKKSVRVRHTFPKTAKNPEGFAIEKEVSASDGRFIDNNRSEINSDISSNQNRQNISKDFNPEPIKSTPRKRPQGTSLDMFRNMARNIGK